MNKFIKSASLIGLIALLLLASKSNAQTVVSANCKTVTLTPVKVAYLKSFKNPVVNQALDSSTSIKYTSTADVIMLMLSLPGAPKDKKDLIASGAHGPNW